MPPPECIVAGELCDETADCCEGLICYEEGFCAPPPPTCAPEGMPCVELPCCADLVCSDTGICGPAPVDPGEPPAPPPAPPVTQLPDTGAGRNGQGAEWLIPTALGAAAAAIAARKLRESAGEPNGDLS
ncbi:MAG: hypothetical protein IT334_00430 [Thermomicrobiales bacterium]|nr:hypothetical protein [Thermomicrobiales bacterium]